MAEKNKKGGFILQAGILATAGILCRIIGILYRSPLTSIIGDEGNGYYSSAYNIYVIILLVSSYSIPSAISKVIAGKLALKEHKNAYKVFQCALFYVIVVGGIASLFTFFCADFLVQENSAAVLRVFAPTIFLSGLLGVLRGFCQAYGTMMPTSVSQILEQILNAAASVGAAFWFVSMVEKQSDTTRAVYGAAGSAVGTGIGVLTALVFMGGVYLLNRRVIRRSVKRDTGHKEDTYGQVFRTIISMVTPIILSTFIYNFSTSLNQTVYSRILSDVKGMAESEIATMYGIFAGKAVVISNIPIAMASAMSAAIIPAISASYAVKDKRQVKAKISQAIRTTMLISIPSAVGLAVLARPVTALLFPQKASLDQAAMLLASISITVVFYGLSTITNGVLQAVGRVNLPVLNAAAALAVQTALLVALLLRTDANLYALSIAMIVYSFLMCVLNQIAVRRTLKYKQEMMKTFIKPFLASVLMGLAGYGVYTGVYYLLPVNAAALAAAILAAGVVYFVTVMALGGVEEEDLRRLPKGYLLVAFGRKLYLLRDPAYVKPDRGQQKIRQERKEGAKGRSGKAEAEKARGGMAEAEKIRGGQAASEKIRGGKGEAEKARGGMAEAEKIRGGQAAPEKIRPQKKRVGNDKTEQTRNAPRKRTAGKPSAQKGKTRKKP